MFQKLVFMSSVFVIHSVCCAMNDGVRNAAELSGRVDAQSNIEYAPVTDADVIGVVNPNVQKDFFYRINEIKSANKNQIARLALQLITESMNAYGVTSIVTALSKARGSIAEIPQLLQQLSPDVWSNKESAMIVSNFADIMNDRRQTLEVVMQYIRPDTNVKTIADMILAVGSAVGRIDRLSNYIQKFIKDDMTGDDIGMIVCAVAEIKNDRNFISSRSIDLLGGITDASLISRIINVVDNVIFEKMSNFIPLMKKKKVEIKDPKEFVELAERMSAKF